MWKNRVRFIIYQNIINIISKDGDYVICPKCNFQTDSYKYCPKSHVELVDEDEIIIQPNDQVKKNLRTKAQVTFDDIFKAIAPTPEEYREEGDSYYNLGNMVEAIKCYDNAIDAADNAYKKSYNYCFKGIRLINKGMDEEALKCFDEGINVCPTYILNWYKKGTYLFSHENYENSLICFEKITEIDSTQEKFWQYKIACLEELGKYDEAINICENIMNIAITSDTNYFINKKEEIKNKINNSSEELEKCEKELLSLKNEIKNIQKENLEKKINNLKEVVKNQRISPLLEYLEDSGLSLWSKKYLKDGLIDKDWENKRFYEEMKNLIKKEEKEKEKAKLISIINNSGLDENHQKRLRRKVNNEIIKEQNILNDEIESLKRVHR